MLCNIGIADRLFRAVVGGALISLTYFGPQTPWGWVGLIPLTTSILCFCPIYGVIGLSTCGKK